MFEYVNDNNFDEQVLNAKGVILVNVWAGWSEGCKQMSTTMHKLGNLLDEPDRIVQIDWDHQELQRCPTGPQIIMADRSSTGSGRSPGAASSPSSPWRIRPPTRE